jgi:hypothetical protein
MREKTGTAHLAGRRPVDDLAIASHRSPQRDTVSVFSGFSASPSHWEVDGEERAVGESWWRRPRRCNDPPRKLAKPRFRPSQNGRVKPKDHLSLITHWPRRRAHGSRWPCRAPCPTAAGCRSARVSVLRCGFR